MGGIIQESRAALSRYTRATSSESAVARMQHHPFAFQQARYYLGCPVIPMANLDRYNAHTPILDGEDRPILPLPE